MAFQGPPPHLRRLLDRLEASREAVVQVWGWPGTGVRAVLDAVAGIEGTRAEWVEVAQLGSARRWDPRIRWLVCDDRRSLAPEEVADSLGDERRLLLGRRERWSCRDAEVCLLTPGEMLLSADEVASMATGEEGRAVTPGLLHRLWWATDGWYRPVQMALEAGLGEDRLQPTATGLLKSGAVEAFLDREVLAPLEARLGELLAELALAESLEPAFWHPVWGEDEARQQQLAELLERHGLAVEQAEGGRRLPRLLRAFLRRRGDGRDTGPGAWRRRQRVALASYLAAPAAEALAAAVAGGEEARLTALIRDRWQELLVAAAPEPLAGALELCGDGDEAVGRLLALAVEAVLGDREEAAGRLEEMAARGGEAAVATTAGLLAAALRLPEPAPAAAAAVRHHLPTSGRAGKLLALLAEMVERGVQPPLAAQVDLAPDSVVSRLIAVAREWLPPARSAMAEAPPALEEHRPPAEAEGPRYRVELLGLARVVFIDGEEEREVRWSLRRAFLLFALLAASPDMRAGRGEMVEAAWPDAPGEVVARNFHPTLSHLRRSLEAARVGGPPVLLFEQGVYRLNPELRWQVDAVEFMRLSALGRERRRAGDTAGAVAHLQTAWQLYAGPFLEGIYAGWVEELRELYFRRYLDVLRQLGEGLSELGDLDRAMDAFRAALVADPLQEKVHLALMRVYARQGRRDRVRHQYDRLSTLLRDELGVEPMAETTNEYRHLMG